MKSFGMDQNGNVRKEKKAESLFFCVCVPRTRILKDKLFLSEVKTCAKSYNFYRIKLLKVGCLTVGKKCYIDN